MESIARTLTEHLDAISAPGWLVAATPTLVNLAFALLIFVVGRLIARMVTNMVKAGMGRAGTDATLISFLGNVVYGVLLVAVIIAALGQTGFETTSLLAIFGAAGLAVGLALKDSLANFSSGVMLIIFRPFRAGDFVDAGGTMGIVETITVFNTVMRTPDNREIIIPNSQIFGGTITNFSARATRRIDMVIGISYDDDIGEAKRIMEGVVGSDERVLAEPAPQIIVLELGACSVDMAVRPWCASADYWDLRSDLLREIKVKLEAAGLSIPYPQSDVHLHKVGD